MHVEDILNLLDSCKQTGTLLDGTRACLLCKDECPDQLMYFGIWIPEGEPIQSRTGCSKERLAKGGARILLYMLCPTCFAFPNKREDVERTILKRISVQ